MKKALFIIILLVSCLSFIQAETVLCCISDNGDEDEKSPWKVQVLRAFEDGVLNEFFDAGHIVTNSFINECRKIAGADAKDNSDIARIMGNRMGADSVILLKLVFPSASLETLPIPSTVEYSFYTNTGKVIAGESVEELDIPHELGEEELLDNFTAYAGGIASGLATRLQ